MRDRDNPLYADILRRFRAATGLPVLVNTSFDTHGEPRVNQPAESLRAARRPRRFRGDRAVLLCAVNYRRNQNTQPSDYARVVNIASSA